LQLVIGTEFGEDLNNVFRDYSSTKNEDSKLISITVNDLNNFYFGDYVINMSGNRNYEEIKSYEKLKQVIS
jgi:hypothetical protein